MRGTFAGRRRIRRRSAEAALRPTQHDGRHLDLRPGIGVALWTELGPNAPIEHAEGLGLVGGVRYKLNESGRWGLGFDITYGEPFPDFSALGAQFTINVLSH